jgi:hypothetical protein
MSSYIKERIIKALDLAYEKQLSDGLLDTGAGFKIAPQVSAEKSAISIWAKLLSDGYIKPYEVLWAIRFLAHKKEFLAVRVTLPTEGIFYFNLRCGRDSDDFDSLGKKMDEKLRTFIPDIEESNPF